MWASIQPTWRPRRCALSRSRRRLRAVTSNSQVSPPPACRRGSSALACTWSPASTSNSGSVDRSRSLALEGLDSRRPAGAAEDVTEDAHTGQVKRQPCATCGKGDGAAWPQCMAPPSWYTSPGWAVVRSNTTGSALSTCSNSAGGTSPKPPYRVVNAQRLQPGLGNGRGQQAAVDQVEIQACRPGHRAGCQRVTSQRKRGRWTCLDLFLAHQPGRDRIAQAGVGCAPGTGL